MALDMGADFIEPDLVFSKDGHLIIRHDNYLSASTNVSGMPNFADRKRVNPSFVEGHGEGDWWVEDFTLTELKTLKLRQAFPGRSTALDDQFIIVSFSEFLMFVQKQSEKRGFQVGIYPETKNFSYYKGLGYNFNISLQMNLSQFGYLGRDKNCYIQSFEADILSKVMKKTDTRTILLLDDPADYSLDDATALGVTGVGPSKTLLSKDGKDTGFVTEAHDLGLEVHPYTFRDDAVGEGFANIEEELAFYFNLGIDALFTDFTDTAVKARLISKS
jgi:glycerophosphoryl diester phosphodiesterase